MSIMQRFKYARILAAHRGEPWFGQIEWFSAVEDIILNGGDLEAMLDRKGKTPEYSMSMQIRDGVAIIPVMGPLLRRASGLQEVSGIASYERINQDLQNSLKDDSIKEILLWADGPGGHAKGMLELTRRIRSANTIKPVYTLFDGFGASATFGVGIGAGQVYATEDAHVGSVGTLISFDKESNSTVIVSDESPEKYHDPNTPEGKAAWKKHLNVLTRQFTDMVAEMRGTTPENVRANYGKGDIVFASDALQRGMIDGISNLEGMLDMIISKRNNNTGAMSMSTTNGQTTEQPKNGGDGNTSEQTNSASGAGSGTDTTLPDPAAMERQRVAGIYATVKEFFPGNEGHQVVIAAVQDGTSTGDQVMKSLLRAEQENIGTSLRNRGQDKQELNGVGTDSEQSGEDEPGAVAKRMAAFVAEQKGIK